MSPRYKGQHESIHADEFEKKFDVARPRCLANIINVTLMMQRMGMFSLKRIPNNTERFFLSSMNIFFWHMRKFFFHELDTIVRRLLETMQFQTTIMIISGDDVQ